MSLMFIPGKALKLNEQFVCPYKRKLYLLRVNMDSPSIGHTNSTQSNFLFTNIFLIIKMFILVNTKTIDRDNKIIKIYP